MGTRAPRRHSKYFPLCVNVLGCRAATWQPRLLLVMLMRLAQPAPVTRPCWCASPDADQARGRQRCRESTRGRTRGVNCSAMTIADTDACG